MKNEENTESIAYRLIEKGDCSVRYDSISIDRMVSLITRQYRKLPKKKDQPRVIFRFKFQFDVSSDSPNVFTNPLQFVVNHKNHGFTYGYFVLHEGDTLIAYAYRAGYANEYADILARQIREMFNRDCLDLDPEVYGYSVINQDDGTSIHISLEVFDSLITTETGIKSLPHLLLN